MGQSKILNFIDKEVSQPKKYFLKNMSIPTSFTTVGELIGWFNADNATPDLDPNFGTIYKAGTVNNASNLNGAQQNGVFKTTGTRSDEGSYENYTLDITGLDTFFENISGGPFDIQLLFTPAEANTKITPRIEINNIEYLLKKDEGTDLAIGDLLPDNYYLIILDVDNAQAKVIQTIPKTSKNSGIFVVNQSPSIPDYDTYIQEKINSQLYAYIIISPGVDYEEKNIEKKGVTIIDNNIPKLINSVPISGGNLNARMVVNNGILYLCEYANDKISLWDLADPKNPIKISDVATNLNPRHVEVHGNYMFVACHGSSELQIFNIQYPTLTGSPTATIPTGSNPKMFTIVEGCIYIVCHGPNTVEKYRINELNKETIDIEKIAEVGVSSNPLAISYNDENLFAVVGLSGNLDLIGKENFDNFTNFATGGATSATCEFVNKTNILVTDTDNGALVSINIEDVLSPVISKSESLGDNENPEQVQIVGNMAYIPELTGGTPAVLSVVDISDYKNPVLVKNIDASVTGGGFTAGYKNYLYFNGHFAPYNLDIVQIKEDFGNPINKSINTNIFKFNKDATYIATHTVQAWEEFLRVGLTFTLTLEDPEDVVGKILTITNVGSDTSVVTINNAYAESTPLPSTLTSGETLILKASEYLGAYQWDVVAYITERVVTTPSNYYNVRSTGTNTTSTAEDAIIRTDGTITVTLHDPSTCEGQRLTITKVGSTGSTTIDNPYAGVATSILTTEDYTIELFSDGSQWDRFQFV